MPTSPLPQPGAAATAAPAGVPARRTAVVTGGARGLGLATAVALARRGLHVVVVARDPEHGRAACQAVTAAGDPEARLIRGDLGCRREVSALALRLLAECPRIDLLVHNAGVWPSALRRNEDGLEAAFAVNHLAPFQLNLLLEHRLAASGGRVVQVGAGLYVKGKVNPAATPSGDTFHALRTYADTKLCNLLALPGFAARWAACGVTIDALHPGVLRTGLGDRPGAAGALLRLVKRTWKAPEVGADAVVALALDAPEGSGRWFIEREEAPLEACALDADLAAVVWEQALRLTGTAGCSPPGLPA